MWPKRSLKIITEVATASLWITSVLLCCLILVRFTIPPGKVRMITLRQILTHSGGSLREVAQWLWDWGESSGSVHSSGTAVRCGPFPLSQIYKATCNNTHWSLEFTSYSRDAIFHTLMFYQKLNGGDVSVYSKYRNFVPTTKLERTYSILKLANKRDKGGRQRRRNWELVEFCCTSANLGFSLTILQGGDRDVTVKEYVMRTAPNNQDLQKL